MKYILHYLICTLSTCCVFSQGNDPIFNNYGMILRRDSGRLYPSTGFVAYRPNIVICAAHSIRKKGDFLFQPSESKKRYELSVLHLDTINDIAILVCDSSISEYPLIISDDKEIAMGDSIIYCGFHFLMKKFIVGKSAITQLKTDNLDRFSYRSKTIQGFSGGAVLNSKYEVIGVQILISILPWEDPLGDNLKTTIASETKSILFILEELFKNK